MLFFNGITATKLPGVPKATSAQSGKQLWSTLLCSNQPNFSYCEIEHTSSSKSWSRSFVWRTTFLLSWILLGCIYLENWMMRNMFNFLVHFILKTIMLTAFGIDNICIQLNQVHNDTWLRNLVTQAINSNISRVWKGTMMQKVERPLDPKKEETT